MTKIKLCGMMRRSDIEAVNTLPIDYVGFVFAPGRKRTISKEAAKEFRNLLNPQIKAVGVFLDNPFDEIIHLAEADVIDVIQLHGHEDDEFIQRIREKTDKMILKAFRIDTAEDIAKANRSTADHVLLDYGIGGTGIAFDWSLLKGMTREYFLAGGLNCGNITDALEHLKPYAVDVSSGIETEGKKDIEKMKRFVQLVRGGYEI